jgi:hypothetical protein
MSKIFSKKDINNIILKETKGYYILNKSDLKLNEDNSNAYVEPSSDSISSLSSDLAKTKSENPTDDQFIVNANSYDGNSSNNSGTLDVQGDNPTDATKKVLRLGEKDTAMGKANKLKLIYTMLTNKAVGE